MGAIRTHCRLAFTLSAVSLCLLTASPAAANRTSAGSFHAWSKAGHVTFPSGLHKGSCWTSSALALRPDAWRCTMGNQILDPCFSTGADNYRVVACPRSAIHSVRGTRLRLSSRLPWAMAHRRVPLSARDPWWLRLTSGNYCWLNGGATAAVDGLRANYGCTAMSDWLWGSPNRRSSPWRIGAGGIQVHSRYELRRVYIRTAVF